MPRSGIWHLECGIWHLESVILDPGARRSRRSSRRHGAGELGLHLAELLALGLGPPDGPGDADDADHADDGRATSLS